jgi:hypothetical protein
MTEFDACHKKTKIPEISQSAAFAISSVALPYLGIKGRVLPGIARRHISIYLDGKTQSGSLAWR